MKEYDWLRWVSFLAGVYILIFFILNAKEILGSKIEHIEHSDVFLLLLGIILPALITSLLSLFKKFWWVLPFGVWFVFLGTFESYERLDFWVALLIVSALVLLFAPFINMVLRRTKSVFRELKK